MAATKCRQRKLERIQELEAQVQMERENSANLEKNINELQKTISDLKSQLNTQQRLFCNNDSDLSNI